jgi:hypothetical protein
MEKTYERERGRKEGRKKWKEGGKKKGQRADMYVSAEAILEVDPQLIPLDQR